MLRKQSRRRTNKRWTISLVLVCLAIVIGIVGGLSLNLVHSAGKNNPTFIENYGSMSKNSDVSVQVYSNGKDGEEGVSKGPDNPSSGNSNKPDQGSSMGHGKDASSHSGKESTSHSSDNDQTPAVIVDEYGHNQLPQTGEYQDHSAFMGMTMMGILLAITLKKKPIKVF